MSAASHGEMLGDGAPTCLVCGQAETDDVWCALVGGLVCTDCCHRVRNLDPAAFVDAFSRAKVTLSPTEVVRACGSCAGNRTSARGEEALDSPYPS